MLQERGFWKLNFRIGGRKPPGHNPWFRGFWTRGYVRQSWNLAFKSAMCDSVGFIRPCHWTGDTDLGGVRPGGGLCPVTDRHSFTGQLYTHVCVECCTLNTARASRRCPQMYTQWLRLVIHVQCNKYNTYGNDQHVNRSATQNCPARVMKTAPRKKITMCTKLNNCVRFFSCWVTL